MAKQHEIEAKKAQLIDSYGPDGLAQMVIKLESDRDALAARVERLERTGDHLRYIWDGTQNLPPDAEIDEACKNWSDARKEAKPAALDRVKAEAVREAIDKCAWYGDRVWMKIEDVKAHAQRLIDEAGE